MVAQRAQCRSLSCSGAGSDDRLGVAEGRAECTREALQPADVARVGPPEGARLGWLAPVLARLQEAGIVSKYEENTKKAVFEASGRHS